jgi:protein required for attachment to host cells
LVIVAGPAFLGLIRSALSPGVEKLVVAEVRKDLLKGTDESVREHLPIEIFQSAL